MADLIKTAFTDAAGDAPKNMGKTVDSNNYDQFSGTASGDSDSGGYLGKILTSVTIGGAGPDSKLPAGAGVGEYKAEYPVGGKE